MWAAKDERSEADSARWGSQPAHVRMAHGFAVGEPCAVARGTAHQMEAYTGGASGKRVQEAMEQRIQALDLPGSLRKERAG